MLRPTSIGLVAAFLASTASGQEEAPATPPAGSGLVGGSAAGRSEAGATPRGFGEVGSAWLTLGGGMAYDFDGSTDLDVFARYSRFLARDVEAGLEGGLWHFNQDGENPLGLSAAVLFRWHFIHQPDWTAFMDGGIGVLGASDNVPAGGTGFDLMPRIGIGFTRRLTDAGLRLEGGLRWHHISNARLQGDDENPSRDGPMLYAGVTMPF